jgi:hypothetical protein
LRAVANLAASQPREAAPSDTDKEAWAERLFYAARRDDWGVANDEEREEFYDMADYILSHPVQVEVTDDMVERAEQVWWDARSTGQVSPMRATIEAALGGGE